MRATALALEGRSKVERGCASLAGQAASGGGAPDPSRQHPACQRHGRFAGRLPDPLPRYDLTSRPTIAPAGNGDDRSMWRKRRRLSVVSRAKPPVGARQVENRRSVRRVRQPRASAPGAYAMEPQRTFGVRKGLRAFERDRQGDAGGATAPSLPSPACWEGKAATPVETPTERFRATSG
jgi:hypothetical protein